MHGRKVNVHLETGGDSWVAGVLRVREGNSYRCVCSLHRTEPDQRQPSRGPDGPLCFLLF